MQNLYILFKVFCIPIGINEINAINIKLINYLTICTGYDGLAGGQSLDLLYENKKLNKTLGSSDWNKNLNELTDAQLQYCSGDVIYLHKIKDELHKMLKREKRLELYENCMKFLTV